MPATNVLATSALNIGAGGTIYTEAATDNVNGNTFTQDGRTLLRLNNTAGTPQTVTFTYPVSVDGAAVPSKVLTLATTEVRYVACGMSNYDKYLYPNGLITFTSNSALIKYSLINF